VHLTCGPFIVVVSREVFVCLRATWDHPPDLFADEVVPVTIQTEVDGDRDSHKKQHHPEPSRLVAIQVVYHSDHIGDTAPTSEGVHLEDDPAQRKRNEQERRVHGLQAAASDHFMLEQKPASIDEQRCGFHEKRDDTKVDSVIVGDLGHIHKEEAQKVMDQCLFIQCGLPTTIRS
jgi:hypothetical protein